MSHPRPSICTASGIEFFPLTPRVEDVRLEDIAHALSHVARFAGHTFDFYSVAQHCVHVVEILRDGGVGNREALQLGLLHDASEAYLGDVPGPLKRTPEFAAYRDAEAHLESVIWQAFGMREASFDWPLVKAADRLALEAEQRALMPDCDWWDRRRATFTVVPWPASLARERFLDLASELGLQCDAGTDRQATPL